MGKALRRELDAAFRFTGADKHHHLGGLRERLHIEVGVTLFYLEAVIGFVAEVADCPPAGGAHTLGGGIGEAIRERLADRFRQDVAVELDDGAAPHRIDRIPEYFASCLLMAGMKALQLGAASTWPDIDANRMLVAAVLNIRCPLVLGLPAWRCGLPEQDVLAVVFIFDGMPFRV